MSVRAKVYCEAITETLSGKQPRLRVVTRGEDNKEWAKYTPTGTIEMTILNEAAAAQFVIGDEYFVTFERVPDDLQKTEGMG